MKCTSAVAITFVGLGFAVADKTGPVEKVVNLLEDLQAKIKNDGKAEQQVYDKFACWCETTANRKADAINTASADLRSMGQQILKSKGQIAVLEAEMKKLEEDMDRNQKEQEEATQIRQKENTAYSAETTEMKEALAAMQKAIVVLRDATTLLQQGDASAVARSVAAVRALVQALPTSVALKPEQTAFLSEFAASGRYAPQSESIQGILRDMYDTFSTNLESSTQTEATANRNFEDLIAVKTQEFNEMKASLEKKTGEKADAENLLADTTQSYDDTESQKKADTAFFDETKAACESKSDEWNTRSEMRAEELKGIEEALKILTSDDARALFASAIKPGQETGASFLQVSRNVLATPTARAYEVIKAKAKQWHSLRLGMLAVQIRNAKAGHFDEVITAIDTMVTTLKEEGSADIAKRDECKQEYQTVASKVGDIDWKIEKNDAKIDKLQGLIQKRTAEKEKTIADIDEVKEQIKEMTAQREEEHADFQHAKSEDQSAIELLVMAKAKLSSFYDKNAKLGKIQGSSQGLDLLEEPVFEKSADAAPDADFSGKGSRKGEAKGIVSILTMVIEDLNDEITNGMKAEAATQLDFEKMLSAAETLQSDLETKKGNLEEAIANLGEEKTDESKAMDGNNEDLKDEKDYRAKIQPDCDWILKAFSGRATARTAEMNGLEAAKEHLVGAAAKGSLLEKRAIFDDAALGRVGFLSLGR